MIRDHISHQGIWTVFFKNIKDQTDSRGTGYDLTKMIGITGTGIWQSAAGNFRSSDNNSSSRKLSISPTAVISPIPKSWKYIRHCPHSFFCTIQEIVEYRPFCEDSGTNDIKSMERNHEF